MGDADLRPRCFHASHSEAATEDFASLAASFYDGGVLELEVYAAGVRDLNKILELDPKFGGAIPAELWPKTKTQLLET